MSEPFVGEIRTVSFNYAPRGFAFCDGALLPKAQNEILFGLIGTTYGGDGVNDFAVPDMRGRIAIGAGQGPGLTLRTVGESGGADSVALTAQQIPTHSHAVTADSAAASSDMPNGRYLARGSKALYAAPTSPVPLSTTAASTTGGTAHENRMPFLGLTFVISLEGVLPPTL